MILSKDNLTMNLYIMPKLYIKEKKKVVLKKIKNVSKFEY